MCSAKTDQSVCRVTKTQQRTAHFQIKIRLIAPCEIAVTEIGYACKKRHCDEEKPERPCRGRPAAEKLGDSGPKSQAKPLIADKNQQARKNARQRPFRSL